MISGLNHLTLSVSDLQRSFDFYTRTLGFKPKARWRSGAYLEIGELWLCLSLGESQPAQDYTHFAFTVDEACFADFTSRLEAARVELWQSNVSEGDSYYFADPDGHKLEAHVGSLNSRLASMKSDLFEDLVVFEDPIVFEEQV